jgi:uncharacterized protein YbjQ (UPF0145 family)
MSASIGGAGIPSHQASGPLESAATVGPPPAPAIVVVTTEAVPGQMVDWVIGEVVGVEVRSTNPFHEGIKLLTTGDAAPDRCIALARWRHEAVARMAAEAAQRGADAVIGMKFDSRQLASGWSEVCAYGTAVRFTRSAAV